MILSLVKASSVMVTAADVKRMAPLYSHIRVGAGAPLESQVTVAEEYWFTRSCSGKFTIWGGSDGTSKRNETIYDC